MEKIKNFIDKNTVVILVALVIMFAVSNCAMSSKMSSLKKATENSIDSLKVKLEKMDNELSEVATKEEIKKSNTSLMYEFLLYEDDLDKGKISLSGIKEKLIKDRE